jgi:hypothetical protein
MCSLFHLVHRALVTVEKYTVILRVFATLDLDTRFTIVRVNDVSD